MISSSLRATHHQENRESRHTIQSLMNGVGLCREEATGIPIPVNPCQDLQDNITNLGLPTSITKDLLATCPLITKAQGPKISGPGVDPTTKGHLLTTNRDSHPDATMVRGRIEGLEADHRTLTERGETTVLTLNTMT